MMTNPPPPPDRRRHKAVAFSVAATVAIMLGMSYAAVPLYKIFCSVTGYGGTPRVAEAAPTTRGTRTLTVRFDANVAPGLPWAFAPETPSIRLRTGETATVFFKVTNETDRAISAQAAYNVSPDQAGSYFDKITCFCFNEQTLGPTETAEMPVVFFLDPALEKDQTMAGVGAVTLSYTFFATRDQPAPVALAGQNEKPAL
jgi:cytochrome c oxidase assembly protein subunit 11